MTFDDIEKFSSVNRNAPLLSNSRQYASWNGTTSMNLTSYEGKYPKCLFNKGVRLVNEDHVGHVIRETEDKILIFGHENFKNDVPKSKIATMDRNVILAFDLIWLSVYKVDMSSPLPLNSPSLLRENQFVYDNF